MYNERLENLIDAALADGELTEKEKQILFKNAQVLGVDLDLSLIHISEPTRPY